MVAVGNPATPKTTAPQRRHPSARLRRKRYIKGNSNGSKVIAVRIQVPVGWMMWLLSTPDMALPKPPNPNIKEHLVLDLGRDKAPFLVLTQQNQNTIASPRQSAVIFNHKKKSYLLKRILYVMVKMVRLPITWKPWQRRVEALSRGENNWIKVVMKSYSKVILDSSSLPLWFQRGILKLILMLLGINRMSKQALW